jgi:hypothetical protein
VSCLLSFIIGSCQGYGKVTDWTLGSFGRTSGPNQNVRRYSYLLFSFTFYMLS